jgi:hypothetical protein
MATSILLFMTYFSRLDASTIHTLVSRLRRKNLPELQFKSEPRRTLHFVRLFGFKRGLWHHL